MTTYWFVSPLFKRAINYPSTTNLSPQQKVSTSAISLHVTRLLRKKKLLNTARLSGRRSNLLNVPGMYTCTICRAITSPVTHAHDKIASGANLDEQPNFDEPHKFFRIPATRWA